MCAFADSINNEIVMATLPMQNYSVLKQINLHNAQSVTFSFSQFIHHISFNVLANQSFYQESFFFFFPFNSTLLSYC